MAESILVSSTVPLARLRFINSPPMLSASASLLRQRGHSARWVATSSDVASSRVPAP